MVFSSYTHHNARPSPHNRTLGNLGQKPNYFVIFVICCVDKSIHMLIFHHTGFSSYQLLWSNRFLARGSVVDKSIYCWLNRSFSKITEAELSGGKTYPASMTRKTLVNMAFFSIKLTPWSFSYNFFSRTCKCMPNIWDLLETLCWFTLIHWP